MASLKKQHHNLKRKNSFVPSKYSNPQVDNKIIRSSNKKSDVCIVKKSPTSAIEEDPPFFMYERAALFLEQFNENRKHLLKHVRKMRSETEEKIDYSSKYNPFPYDPRTISLTNPINRKTFQAENYHFQGLPTEMDLLMQKEHNRIWEMNPTLSEAKMLCHSDHLSVDDDDDDDDDDHQEKDQIDETHISLMALNRKHSKMVEEQQLLEQQQQQDQEDQENQYQKMEDDDKSICIIVYLALFLIYLSNKFVYYIETALHYAKSKLTFMMLDSWTRWNMSSLVKTKEYSRNKMTIACFCPIMAVFATMYSCVWIACTVNKIMQKPVPPKLLKRFKNFKQLLD